jgi:hypothetical protein
LRYLKNQCYDQILPNLAFGLSLKNHNICPRVQCYDFNNILAEKWVKIGEKWTILTQNLCGVRPKMIVHNLDFEEQCQFHNIGPLDF